MLTVIFIDNPFSPFLQAAERVSVVARTVREALESLHPGFTEFAHPTLCLVNGEPFMRARWNDLLTPETTVTFVRLAQGIIDIIIALIILIVAVVVTLLFVGKANNAAIGAGTNQQQNGITVYQLSGQKNQVRLNNAIECVYGYNRLYPAYAATPYNVYNGNNQYQFSLFCLGHGNFSITNPSFEDTPASQFQGVTIEYCPPGHIPSLVHAAVYTSADVNDIELYAKNEPNYNNNPTGFAVCAPGERCNRIEVDISLPVGLFYIDDAGEIAALRVTVRFEYAPINDAGAMLGGWTTLTDWKDTDKTLDPKRFTLGFDVGNGRYAVRAYRTNSKNTTGRSGDQVKWEALRSFLPFTADFGDVTLVAVKALATNQLNNNSASRFNVYATRLIPVWNPDTGWADNSSTRNPVWAFCDVFRASYGGRLSDSFLDLPTLYTLAAFYDTNSISFDYIFDQRSTVWEAAKAIARIGRGVPMLTGSQLSIIRDRSQTAATAIFNQNNIIAGSFQWSVKLPTVAENDGIEIEYFDNQTWIAETVVCLLDDDTGNNPAQVKLPGCTDRTRAFQEGLYQRACERYQNETIDFKTGLEGHLPLFGDLILVSHDVPRWGQAGRVIEMHTDGIYTVLTLSEPVTFIPATTHKLILRKKDGSAYGPVTVITGDTAKQVKVTPVIEETFYFDEIHESPYFLFGQENLECKRCVVIGITPDGDDIVTIRAIAYDERIFSFGDVPTPGRYATPTPVTYPPLPIVGPLTVSQVSGELDFVRVYWAPALGAHSYQVETSTDGVTYVIVAKPLISSITLRVTGGFIYIRVAGLNVGLGPYSNWSGNINVDAIPADVTGLVLLYESSGSVTIQWDATPYSDRYSVAILDGNNSRSLRTDIQATEQYTYTLAQAITDGITSRKVIFKIRAKNAYGLSINASVLNIVIPYTVSVPPTIPISLRCDNTHVFCDTTHAKADHT